MNNQILWVDLIIAYALLKIVADVFVKLIFDVRFFAHCSLLGMAW